MCVCVYLYRYFSYVYCYSSDVEWRGSSGTGHVCGWGGVCVVCMVCLIVVFYCVCVVVVMTPEKKYNSLN